MASAVSVVALTGFMGSGKTTVGGLVAERLGWSFIDSDDALQEAAGKSIDRIFREEGEEAFRRLERKTLESILGEPKQHGLILALGGGAVMSPSVRETLKRVSYVIQLDIDPEVAWRRTRDHYRPLAQSRDEFGRMFRDRRKTYALAAQHSVNTTTLSEHDAAQSIVAHLRRAVLQPETTGAPENDEVG